jgi:glycosyltransferase involved in cell wall biosynthesis
VRNKISTVDRMNIVDGRGPTVSLASNVGPTYQGGLGAYQRLLARLLKQRTNCLSTVFCATTHLDFLPPAEERCALPLVQFKRSWLGKASEPIWNRLASKPQTHPVLEFILHRAWRSPRTARTNVIHYIGTGWDFFGFAIAKLARDYRVRLVITPAIHPGSWGSDLIDVRLYHQADRVICFTNQEGVFLQQLGLPQQKLSVCPLPPMCRSDGHGLRFRNKYHLENQLCVLFVGRRDQGKGYPALLKAWLLVLQSIPDAVLILAGTAGEEYREFLARIPSRNVCDLGTPNEIEKADAIAACDIFCLPSAHESFGIVYVDAWSYGKPVICGTAPACREFIDDGKTGLWASQEPNELAEKLVLLSKDRELRKVLGSAGKLEQVKRFNEATFLRSHLNAFGIPARGDKDETPANEGITV